jgi:Chlorite dismutase
MFTTFTAGDSGHWQMLRVAPAIGEALSPATHLAVADGTTIAAPAAAADAGWCLTGVASHVRYVERAEKNALVAVQAGLGRAEATRAALIPIKKSAAWWDLTQDERRKIFEDKSRHIAASMKYLPAIARQLYHARDLASRSTSSPGSNSPPTTPTPSRTWSPLCVRQKSGPMWNARSMCG